MSKLTPPPEIISRLNDAVYPSFALLAGMELDLFTPLKDGPLSAGQIAAAIGVEAARLRPLLYALAAAGLLTAHDSLFSNTAEAAHYLVRGEPAYLGDIWQLTAGNWGRMLKTAESIRSGGPVEEYDYHEQSRQELVALLRGLQPGAILDAKRLLERYDFSKRRALLDVGGGSGALAITVVQANPQLAATVADLPLVTPITRQFIEEAGLEETIQVLTANAVRESVPGRYDVVVARHLAQVLSADDNQALVRNLAAVLEPGGALHLVGWALDDDRLSPTRMVHYNLVLLTAYQHGQAYTEQEYRSWLHQAGLVAFERVILDDGASIVTARKPANVA